MTILYDKVDGTILYSSPVPLPTEAEIGAINITVPEGKVLKGIKIEDGVAAAEFADIPEDETVKALREQIEKQEQELTAVQQAIAEIYESVAG